MHEIFTKLKEEIEQNDEKREQLIVKSRPILKAAKQAIYALHRNEVKESKDKIDEARIGLDELKAIAAKNPEAVTGIYHAAMEEYAEACGYYYYVTEKRLVDPKEIGVDAENYLGGICDLTGELARRATHAVVREDFIEVSKIKEFVEVIHNEVLQFNFRNSDLRKKSDAVKWNMKKIEEILYELKLREKI